MRWSVGVVSTLLAGQLAVAQPGYFNEAADTTFAVSRSGVVDLTLRSGRLVVRGTDRSNAELRAHGMNYQLRTGGASATLTIGESFSRRRSSSSDRRSDDRRSDDGTIELFVPRGVRLVVNGTNNDVDVADVGGDVDVHLMNGDVRLRNIGGRAIVETLTGDVTISDGVGDLRVTTVSGDIVAHGVRGNIDVSTTSGDVTLGAEKAAHVQVDAMSATIVFEGALADDARLQFTTHSGDVVLRLPESAGGTMDVSTFNGDVRGGTMTLLPGGEGVPTGMARGLAGRMSQGSARRYEFGGGGNARITISTFNGDVSLQRGTRRRNE